MARFKLEQKSVNSKPLAAVVREFAEDGILHGGILWSSDTHRDSFIEIVDDFLAELADDDKLSQWNVVCDFRNNKIVDMERGIYNVAITYRQRNCLNMTQLLYRIEDDGEDMTIDFDITFP